MTDGTQAFRVSHGAIALVAAVIGLSGCGSCIFIKTLHGVGQLGARADPLEIPGFSVPKPKPRPAFAFGSATRDITPPPGYPTGGHGPAGAVARGYWLRLKARAFFFEDTSGRALVLVSADLFAAPAGLHAAVSRLVAEELARTGLEVALPPEALVLAATHTHQGPGNFLTARIYNQFGSSYSGFSEELFRFLAREISRAVVAAVVDARAHTEPVEAAVRTVQVDYALVRNRAPRTFLVNMNREQLIADLNATMRPGDCHPMEGEPTTEWEIGGVCARLAAADRALTVVTLSRTEGATPGLAAVLVFFAVHPTVLLHDTPFYSPDFVGYASTALEQRLGGDGRRVTVGFFNGAEGDIVPRRTGRDLLDAVKLGSRFEGWISDLVRTSPAETLRSPEIHVRAKTWHPLKGPEGVCKSTGEDIRLATHPSIGAAALGGAEDDRSVLYDLGWRDGVRDRPRPGQGVKLPALDSQLVRPVRVSETFAPPDAFPEGIPLVLASVGDLRIAAVPVELTTAQGQGLRRALGGSPHGRLELVGLANEYLGYTSSADEYTVQDYMGASTAWGPRQGEYLACRMAQLAAGGDVLSGGTVEARRFWPGSPPQEERFGPAFAGDIVRPDDGLERVLRDAKGLPERHLPWFLWEESTDDGAKQIPTLGRQLSIWHRGSVAWQPFRSREGGPIEDDAGPGFLTMYLGGRRWSAIWLHGQEHRGEGPFAFVVRTQRGEWRCSASFSVLSSTEKPVPESSDCSEFASSGR